MTHEPSLETESGKINTTVIYLGISGDIYFIIILRMSLFLRKICQSIWGKGVWCLYWYTHIHTHTRIYTHTDRMRKRGEMLVTIGESGWRVYWNILCTILKILLQILNYFKKRGLKIW